jgi:hypothetical protein
MSSVWDKQTKYPSSVRLMQFNVRGYTLPCTEELGTEGEITLKSTLKGTG